LADGFLAFAVFGAACLMAGRLFILEKDAGSSLEKSCLQLQNRDSQVRWIL
jgi:hypothetical protein